MEPEALKFRSNKMYEAQMFQGDKGPGEWDELTIHFNIFNGLVKLVKFL